MYTLVYNLQEEAHRFAIKSSQKSKTKTLTHSSLERIPGIGAAKARALLREMTISKIKVSDADTLAKIKGITRRDAEAIYDYYHKEQNSKNDEDNNGKQKGKAAFDS